MRSDLNNLKAMFNNMVFDVKNPLKWSFYFVNDTREGLEQVYNELKDHAYFIEKLENRDDNDWVLKVFKIDILTPYQLHKRNLAFNELAEYCNVDLYDGWEVEEVN